MDDKMERKLRELLRKKRENAEEYLNKEGCLDLSGDDSRLTNAYLQGIRDCAWQAQIAAGYIAR